MPGRDYIVEVIEQFAALVARLGGLRDEKRYDEAEEAIGDAMRLVFGPMIATLEEASAECVPALAHNPDKVALYCMLLREAANIAYSRSDGARASVLHQRAADVERAQARAAASLEEAAVVGSSPASVA